MRKFFEPEGLELAASARVRRTPFYFESQGAWLFGWMHQGESTVRGQRGVIICSPLGYEQIHAHRSLCHLADALAEAGFPVLRFDYHGTGDSDGMDDDADRHATWLENVRSAIDWMNNEVGCAEINVVGIRLGATLAAQVTADKPVADLVLWAPVVKGRAYVQETKFISKSAGAIVKGSKDIEAAGFVMTEQTAHDLSSIDLMQIRPRCRRALLVERDDLPVNGLLLDHLRGLGIETRQTVQPGYVKMMAEPHHTKVPHQAIAEIVSWLCGGEAETQAEPPPDRAWPAEALMVSKSRGLLRERALSLCRLPNLFGILSEPVPHLAVACELPAVVLLNAGSAHHVGPNRLHVLLARRLAAAGVSCLRMDLHGLGDSVNPDSKSENETYPETAFRDIDLAMKSLERETSTGRTVLMGLCSGANAAFQSAVQFANPALLGCVMINPACSDSGFVAFPSHLPTNDLPGNLARAFNTKKLLTFFFARSDPGYGILTSVARHLVEEMCLTGQMRICLIEDADHTFTRRGPREAILDAIVAELSGRYRSAATGGAEQTERGAANHFPAAMLAQHKHAPPSDAKDHAELGRSGDAKKGNLKESIPTPFLDKQRIAAELAGIDAVQPPIEAGARNMRPELATPWVRPRTSLQRELGELWAKVLHLDRVGLQDDFTSLGGDSLAAAQVFVEIEARFGTRLPMITILEAPTVEQMAELMEGGGRTTLKVLRPGVEGGPALFLVHDGEGETLLYVNLARRLPEEITVYGLEPHGQGRCPIVHTRITEMAAHYIEQMRRVRPEGPYFVGGMCAGGVIAFEMAMQLRAKGLPVGFVALLDSAAPGAARKTGLIAKRRWARFLQAPCHGEGRSRLARLTQVVGVVISKARNMLVYEVTTQVGWLFNKVRFRLLRSAVDRGRPVPSYLEGLTVRTVYELAEADYRPAGKLDVPLVLFRATEGEGDDQPFFECYVDALLGWQPYVKAELEAIDITGGHTSMLQEPEVASLSERLCAWFDRARAAKVGI